MSEPGTPAIAGIVKNLEKYPLSFRLTTARIFFDEPVGVDATLRPELDTFASRDPSESWRPVVRGTQIVIDYEFSSLRG